MGRATTVAPPIRLRRPVPPHGRGASISRRVVVSRTSRAPRSTLDTWTVAGPVACARSSCVQPRSSRASRTRCPNPLTAEDAPLILRPRSQTGQNQTGKFRGDESRRSRDRPTDNRRLESERFKPYAYFELVARNKVNLDLTWLRDESLEDADNLPAPDVIAHEIVEDLTAALVGLRPWPRRWRR